MLQRDRRDRTLLAFNPVTRDALLARVNAVRSGLLDGALDAVVADTGGWGLCEYASEELVAALPDLDGWVEYARPWEAHYKGKLAGAHWVAVFDEWVVDLTARQWDASLPYPMIFPRGA